MIEILDENKLSVLPTKKFYDKLDNVKDICHNNTFNISVETILKHYNVHQDVHDKILKGLCYAHGNNFQDESDEDICNFLYYWLGDILYDKIIPMIHFDTVISKIFYILKYRNGKNCTAPTYYNIIEKKYFNDIKLLFDYSKDYDTYKEQISSNNMLCNEKYNEYLQKYVKTYKNFQSECQNKPRSPRYCNAFNDYFVKKDPANLSKLTCTLQNKEPEAEKKIEQVAVESQLLPAQGMEANPPTEAEQFSSGSGEEEKSYGSPVNPSREATAILNRDSGPVDVSSISRTTKTIATTASVAGILLPPFLVYNVISITIVKLILLFYI
ncbi:hypothetical protein PVNG_06231 [Plasmodium vivax North Korean]|uniref:Variable surface protein Vir7-like protein n=1 Tax=Plasmodium vivax North Korean TaxID=1035514 RepID=A0A0J9TMK2_PLAVI|nr:hypothetical protein PVNG_06231 [Plasmodium vivax North Korean]